MNVAELLYSFNDKYEIKQVEEGKWVCEDEKFDTREKALKYLIQEIYYLNSKGDKVNQALEYFNYQYLINADGKYDIVSAIEEIFDGKERMRSFYHIINRKSDEFEPDNIRELMRFALVQSINKNRNPDDLDILLKHDDKQLAFAAYIKLCNLLRGTSVLTHFATNSDFWGHIERARINDGIFLSFHVVNYLYHIGNGLLNSENYTNNISNILNMTKFGHFYEEEKVQETRAFAESLINKLIEITNTGYFDEQILNLYKQMNSVCEVKPEEWTFEGKVEGYFEDGYSWSPLYHKRYLSINK